MDYRRSLYDLVPKVVKQPNGTVPAGRVISSDPQFGNLEPANTAVTLSVSSGPKLVKVPSVVNQNVTAAQNALTAAGLTPSVDGAWAEAESGKFARLRELAEVIAAKQEKMLVFTQFREATPADCRIPRATYSGGEG